MPEASTTPEPSKRGQHMIQLNFGTSPVLEFPLVLDDDKWPADGPLVQSGGNLYISVDGTDIGSLFFHRDAEGNLAIAFGGWEAVQNEEGEWVTPPGDYPDEWTEGSRLSTGNEYFNSKAKDFRDPTESMAIESILSTYQEKPC